jgi:phospholipid/cholesterol/gamma-HCH transport system substrate-binding protein
MIKFQKEVKIGIVVTLIIAMCLWGLNYLKGRNVFTTQQQYFALFDNVAGLKKSSVVSANGYSIGLVTDMSFLPGNAGKILVEISINREFKIPKNSVVEIYSSDIMGSKAVNLVMGNSKQMAAQYDTLPSHLAEDISALLSKQLMPLKTKAENLIVSIDSVMSIVRTTFNRQTQRNIQGSVAGLEDLIVTEKEKISTILDNLQSISKNIEGNNKSINKIVGNLSSLSDSLSASKLKMAIDQAGLALAQTNQILDKINKGKGTIGQMVNNDSLYHSLNRTVKDLDSLLMDLNANPKRYVHFSLFGKNDSKSKK